MRRTSLSLSMMNQSGLGPKMFLPNVCSATMLFNLKNVRSAYSLSKVKLQSGAWLLNQVKPRSLPIPHFMIQSPFTSVSFTKFHSSSSFQRCPAIALLFSADRDSTFSRGFPDAVMRATAALVWLWTIHMATVGLDVLGMSVVSLGYVA